MIIHNIMVVNLNFPIGILIPTFTAQMCFLVSQTPTVTMSAISRAQRPTNDIKLYQHILFYPNMQFDSHTGSLFV